MFRSTAHVYDLIYSAKNYRDEAQALRELIGQHNPGAATLLDVACGTGRHLDHLRRWYRVSGLDLDPGMLAVARQRLAHVQLVEADMRTFQLEDHFDAVVCLFSSIGYLASADHLDQAVANMVRHLSPGGVLVVDGWVRPEAWKEPGTVLAEAVQVEGVAVARAGRSWREGRMSHLELHHLAATLDGVEYLVDHHQLTLFERAEYEAAFRRAGLQVWRVDGPIADRDRYVGVRSTAVG